VTLQRRLALTLVVAAVPIVTGLAWVRVAAGRHADEMAMRDLVLTRASVLGREACEAAPESFAMPFGRGLGAPGERRPRVRAPGTPGVPPGPLPHVEFIVPPAHRGPPGSRPRMLRNHLYDERFRATTPDAPPFPDALRSALDSGSDAASRRLGPDGQPASLFGVEVERGEYAIRTGWSPGPCAYVLVWRDGPPTLAEVHPWIVSLVPLLVGLAAAMWLASGPVVRRVHALAAAVRQSAASRYAEPVPEQGRDEITDLARAFNEAGAEVREHLAAVERRDRTLRSFLANTTHDVMIPLTVLQGHLSSLEREAAAAGHAPPPGVVAAMGEAHHIGSLLHNLGAVAKLESPDDLVQRHPVDLAALVVRVVERHRALARPAGITVEFAVPEEPVTVPGDVTLLEQAIGNVVHNAVRYNRPGGHVAVVLEPAPPPATCRLRVVDDGPGVPPEALGRLTDRRYRDDEARRREPNGSGLGLAIAREVADRHGITLLIGHGDPTGLEVEFVWPGAAGESPR
jgi:signal transduction histidine kinase